jgi:cytochrome c-type biogenesis protein CcmH/NrfG
MSLVIVMLVIIVGVGWFAWRRRQQAHTLRVSLQRKPNENFGHNAFVHGNTYLREGKFDEARTAFHQARELDPKHHHIADRLAEVDRQQQAVASAVAPAN